VEATRLIRQAGLRLPIIALTANAMAGVRNQCLAAGCDDFATKPIDRTTLLAVIRKWLKAAPSTLADVMRPVEPLPIAGSSDGR
jgi:CheY-like chemotaxis protein